MTLPAEIGNLLRALKSQITAAPKQLAEIEQRVGEFERTVDSSQRSARQLRKQAVNAGSTRAHPSRSPVSERCARFFGAITVLGADSFGRLKHLGDGKREKILQFCRATVASDLGIEFRSTLTSADIPLPTVYQGELVSLVEKYGLARKYGTVLAISSQTKLPRLNSSPAFNFIDMSAAIDEKSPKIDFVDFSPEKAGGIIRVPSEIDADSIVDMGRFLTDYCAREAAKWEDTVFFTADGTSTYKSFKGAGKAAVDLGKKVVLSPTRTAPSDIALADLRALRGQVSSAALLNAAYYFNPTMEALLVKFNTPANVTTLAHSKSAPVPMSEPVFVARGKSGGPELDGYPVRWIPVLPAYSEVAAAGQIQAVFGDLSFEYMTMRGAFTLQMNKDVYFATDELAVRALERFAIGLLDDSAIAALQLAF